MNKFHVMEEQVMMSLDIKPYRTEWRIAAPKEGIAGTVDFVGQLPDGTYCIMDWKTTKGMAKKFSNTYKKAKFPIDNLDDCDGVKYSLQLNLYKYILEKYYGLRVSMMMVAAFSKFEPDYFTKEVEDMQETVEELLNHFMLQQRQEAQMNPPSRSGVNLPF